MKHVGKMKNNGAKVAVIYRTLPGDSNHCLVVGTNGLQDAFHDSFMKVLESDLGQQAEELADVLTAKRFPDGSIMLAHLHTNGHLSKVPTNLVLVTPNSKTSIPLDELNLLIAEQKGISIEDLAVKDPSGNPKSKPNIKSEPEILVEDNQHEPMSNEPISASDLRSMADKLFKEAQALRRKADEMDPPKKKTKTEKVEAE